MKNDNLFLPVYINKDRLLDINSILFDGYSEFSEMTLENESGNNRNNKTSVNSGIGMKIFNLGSDLEAGNLTSQTNKETIALKKIQTMSSLLANTLNILKTRKLLKNVDFKVGDFIELTGIFKNNSICDLLDQFSEMMSFAELGNKLSNNIKSSEISKVKEQIKRIKQMIKRKDDLERELVFETNDKIYVIQLQTNNIYNSNFNNICNNELTYFCQVKNISKDYHFFSDTQLFKFDINFLTDFITSLENLIKTQDSYKFNFELIKNSENKEVYELELISIYRKAN